MCFYVVTYVGVYPFRKGVCYHVYGSVYRMYLPKNKMLYNITLPGGYTYTCSVYVFLCDLFISLRANYFRKGNNVVLFVLGILDFLLRKFIPEVNVGTLLCISVTV